MLEEKYARLYFTKGQQGKIKYIKIRKYVAQVDQQDREEQKP